MIQTEHETMVQVIHRAYAGTPGADVVCNEAAFTELWRLDIGSTLHHCTTEPQLAISSAHDPNRARDDGSGYP